MNDTDKKINVITSPDGEALCYIIRASYQSDKTEFFTPSTYSQQLGVIKYPKEGKIKPHYHNLVAREVLYTQEVLVVRRGKVKVNLYDKEKNFVASEILLIGDTILLASGGHGFEMLDDTELLEIKQGPYNGVQKDKTTF
jgi:hypothetical protein